MEKEVLRYSNAVSSQAHCQVCPIVMVPIVMVPIVMCVVYVIYVLCV